ncbi:MAG TPA: hypothetical protein VGK96_22240, partial [Candidatus Sulfotelmatobacter sp.]
VPDPGNSHHWLLGVLALFALLRRLVLLTPLADLLSKRQRRKLPATSNAVRHEINKRVSAVDEVVQRTANT